VPRAAHATAGSGDLCLVSAIPLDDVVRHLNECEIAIIEGPVAKTGATGPIRSVYFRDPDGNLIEVSEYLEQ
jgi:catechol 2,3-dioxygenase-like lactoylglutathione lyase family enzyme